MWDTKLYMYVYTYIYATLGMPWGNVLHSYAAWSMCCSMKNTRFKMVVVHSHVTLLEGGLW